jgi:hypothetical protein
MCRSKENYSFYLCRVSIRQKYLWRYTSQLFSNSYARDTRVGQARFLLAEIILKKKPERSISNTRSNAYSKSGWWSFRKRRGWQSWWWLNVKIMYDLKFIRIILFFFNDFLGVNIYNEQLYEFYAKMWSLPDKILTVIIIHLPI